MALELGPVIGSIGGGGGVEEIPVSMSGGGGTTSGPTVYPLTTVDAGDGAIVLVLGTMDPASTGGSFRPHLQIGSYTHQEPHTYLTGPTGSGVGVMATGSVQIAVLSRDSRSTTFDGTVYVARL